MQSAHVRAPKQPNPNTPAPRFSYAGKALLVHGLELIEFEGKRMVRRAGTFNVGRTLEKTARYNRKRLKKLMRRNAKS